MTGSRKRWVQGGIGDHHWHAGRLDRSDEGTAPLLQGSKPLGRTLILRGVLLVGQRGYSRTGEG
jgi:hypothetical protein